MFSLPDFFFLSFVCFLSRALMLVLSLGVCIFGRKCLSWFFVCVPSSIHLFVNTRIAAFGIQDVLRCLQRSLSFLSMYYDVCQYLYVTNSPVRATRCLPITVLAFFLFFFFLYMFIHTCNSQPPTLIFSSRDCSAHVSCGKQSHASGSVESASHTVYSWSHKVVWHPISIFVTVILWKSYIFWSDGGMDI